MSSYLTLQMLPMTLVSAAAICLGFGLLQNIICKATGSYENECRTLTSYSTTMASLSAVGAIILFMLASMGVLSMPRGGYGYGMGSMGY